MTQASKRPKFKMSQIQNIPGTKQPQPENVLNTKRPKSKTSQLQNSPSLKKAQTAKETSYIY